MREPKSPKLRLVQPSRLMIGACLEIAQMEVVLMDQPPRKGGQPSFANGAKLIMVGPTVYTTPSSVASLTRTASKRQAG